MRRLTFREVQRAGRPAKVELPHVTYEYRPAEDDVSVTIRSHLQPASATYLIPAAGWSHERGCSCLFCSEAIAA